MKEYSQVWQYEGIVFYAYPVNKQPLGALPVYRFWSSLMQHHFYTIDEAEKDKLIHDTPETWIYEGIVWYAFAKPYYTSPATYDFSGGSEGVSYTMTLKAYVDGQEAQIDQPNVQFLPQTTQAKMSIDFANLTITLNEIHILTDTLQQSGTIKLPGISIPFALSAQADFDGLAPRGPYAVDPTTGVFADFVNAPKDLTANQETFSCNGTVTIGGQLIQFSLASSAMRSLRYRKASTLECR